MAITLGGETLQNPNSFSEEQVVTGDYTKTMTGYTRRAIRNVKRIWKISWTQLTETQYTTIKGIFDDNTTKSFTYTDVTPNISATVYIDLGDRSYLAGTGKFLSSIDLILTEV